MVQGVQDKALEAQLPDLDVAVRAEAINALLSQLKLQVGWRVPAGWLAACLPARWALSTY